MKNIKGINGNKTKKGNDVATKGKANSAGTKSTIGPEEYGENRSMDIRMKEQPSQSSAKQRRENMRSRMH